MIKRMHVVTNQICYFYSKCYRKYLWDKIIEQLRLEFNNIKTDIIMDIFNLWKYEGVIV